MSRNNAGFCLLNSSGLFGTKKKVNEAQARSPLLEAKKRGRGFLLFLKRFDSEIKERGYKYSKTFFGYMFKLRSFFLKKGRGRLSLKFLSRVVFFFLKYLKIFELSLTTRLQTLNFFHYSILTIQRVFGFRRFKRAGVVFLVPYIFTQEKQIKYIFRLCLDFASKKEVGDRSLIFLKNLNGLFTKVGPVYAKLQELEDKAVDNRMFSNMFQRKRKKRVRRFL